MAASVAVASSPRHLLPSEIDRLSLAKANLADLRKSETVDFRAQIGACINHARLVVGWDLNEFADALGRDPSQVRRWLTGHERPQFDVLFSVPALRAPLVMAFATLSGEIEITTQISIRRHA
jgi:hypothetical protein